MTEPINRMSSSELLGLLVGRRAGAALARRPLHEVFRLSARSGNIPDEVCNAPMRVLDAARELLQRALAERLRETDCLASPGSVRDLLRLRFSGLPHEVFGVLLLDAQHRLIETVDLFRSTLSQTAVYPREVVKLALARNAAAVVFVHNHPSGVAEPSAADQVLTSALKTALALVDVTVLDHFIVAGTGTPTSLAERGLI